FPQLALREAAQRIRRCGLNATFRTRLQQCDGDWWSLSPRRYRVPAALALLLGTDLVGAIQLSSVLRQSGRGRTPKRNPAEANSRCRGGVSKRPGIWEGPRLLTQRAWTGRRSELPRRLSQPLVEHISSAAR